MADVPIFSYNEQRPAFIGKDVEGIKSLNQAMEQKYNMNKQNYTLIGDTLDALQQLDVDSPIKQQAIDEFQTQFDDIVKNGNYEDAGKILDVASNKIKRNKALKQSVSNYATYAEWTQKLKDDPKGWTDKEINAIVSKSVNEYGGVQIDPETGEPVGTFNTYDPGEKINILDELGEGIKDFAADKGVSEFQARQLFEGNDVNFVASQTTKEEVTKDDLLKYIKVYYKYDPAITKYYETINVINSQKTPEQLDYDFVSTVNDAVFLPSYYNSMPKSFKDAVKKGDQETIDNERNKFLEYFIKKEYGKDVSISKIREDIKSNDPEVVSLAKQELAHINTELGKAIAFNQVAEKDAYTKETISNKFFDDDVAMYMLKQRNENPNFAFDFTTQLTNTNNPLAGKKPLAHMNDKINTLDSNKNVYQEQMQQAGKDAVANGEATWNPTTKSYDWENDNSENKRLYDVAKAKYNRTQYELEASKAVKKEADAYVNDKLKNSPEAKAREAEKKTLRVNITSDIDKAIRKAKEELNAVDGKDLLPGIKDHKRKKYNKRIKGLNSLKQTMSNPELSSDLLYNEETMIEINDLLVQSNVPYKNILNYISLNKKDNKVKEEAYREYFDGRAVTEKSYTMININSDVSLGAKHVEARYPKDKSAHVMLDDRGVPMEQDDYPEQIKINGISAEEFEDGSIYFEGSPGILNKKTNKIEYDNTKKVFMNVINSSVLYKWATDEIDNENPVVANTARNFLYPSGFEVIGTNVLGVYVPLMKDGLEYGKIKLKATPDINGKPDQNNVFYTFTLNPEIRNKINSRKDVTDAEKLPSTMTFDSKVEAEQTLGIIEQLNK